jgi:tRNA pseudouridine55 synthase
VIGFLNLNKPLGWTSHDCVAKVRRSLKIKRVGHGGTLDPLATGVLPIAIGSATRLLNYLPTPKAYRARIRLGVQTTTDDLEGEIIATQAANHLSLAEIKAQLPEFVGTIDQIPPAYSAIQKDGKRFYELARQGIAVDVPVRQVEIYSLTVLNWYPGELPEVDLAIACGGGTYIRAIARDLGHKLGVGATLAALERTLSCGLDIANSLTFEQVFEQQNQGTFLLISPETALSHHARLDLDEVDSQGWSQGKAIAVSQAFAQTFVQSSVGCAFDPAGKLLGIGAIEAKAEAIWLCPKVVLT